MDRITVLEQWIESPYLSARRIDALVESAAAKPVAKYLVLDNFFRLDALARLREHCASLRYSDDDRIAGGQRLPYDSAVKFANASDVGWDLFNSPEWHAYCAKLVGATLTPGGKHVVKLRYHRPEATGFWIHTDAIEGERSIAVIAYFDEGWSTKDGALLQLWREDEALALDVPRFDTSDPEKPLDILSRHRIRTQTPGGNGAPRQPRDFVLIDQIVPERNRVFICNLQSNPAWHSVTPSRGRARHGFVQWIA
jgi:hypothetical protein